MQLAKPRPGKTKILPELWKNLEAALCQQASNDPDMFLVSREGKSLPAHKCVLTLFSPSLAKLLSSCPPHLPPSLLLPDTGFKALCGLLSLFYTGLLPVKVGEEQVLNEVEATAAMMGLKLDLRKPGFGEAPKSERKPNYMETDEACPPKPKAKNPRKQRNSLEPRVSTPEARLSPVNSSSPITRSNPMTRPTPSARTSSPTPPAPPPKSNVELEARLASMWGARAQSSISEKISGEKPRPIDVQSKPFVSDKPPSAGRTCSLCKEKFGNLKELATHIENVHKPPRGRKSPGSFLEKTKSPKGTSSPGLLLGRTGVDEKFSRRRNVFEMPKRFDSK